MSFLGDTKPIVVIEPNAGRLAGRACGRTRRIRSISIAASITAATGLLTACANHGVAGALRSQSLGGDRVVLPANYRVACFSSDDEDGASFMLSDAPADELLKGTIKNGQILHIELLWLPKAGATPMDASATNASIRHVVVANGEVGVYGGAGFAMPQGSLARSTIQITLRDASMQLQESTPGFLDLLSPAQLTGTFSAQRDDKKTRELNYAASQIVTNALGKTTYVRVID